MTAGQNDWQDTVIAMLGCNVYLEECAVSLNLQGAVIDKFKRG